MADKTTSLKTHAEIDKDAVEKFNRHFRQGLDREAKLHKHYEWRGNKLPPMAIEPMAHERQRLATPMSAENRALRKQWVQDQKLVASEPKYIADLYPQNPIRRLLAAPWNMAESMLKPIMGANLAGKFRFYGPRATMTAFVAWGMWYNLKYTPNTWTTKTGWHTYESRDIVLPGDPNWPRPPEKTHDEFFDRGFKSRTVFQN